MEKVAGNRALIAESPTWDERDQSLLWVDILRGEIHRFRPDTGQDDVTFVAPTTISSVVTRRSGGLLAAAGMGFAGIDEESHSWQAIAWVDRGNRLNEARCDPIGRLWGGTMASHKWPGTAALYRLDGYGPPELILDGVSISNGLAWSPDGSRMYYTDTLTERIDVFDYDLASGNIGSRRLYIDLRDVDGKPDGLAIDEDGGLWVAMVRGGAIRRYSPGGSLDYVLPMPVPTVTSCAFGGPELRDLYVTTLCVGLSEAQLADYPGAGSVFCVPQVGVRGSHVPSFRG